MEFDKSKILTAITARQAKEGQRGWFGECEDEIVRNLEYEPSSIKEIDRSRAYAFRSESDFCLYPFFYPAPEPTYRPYSDDELNDLVGKVLIQNHTGNAMMAIKVCYGEVGKLISLGGSQKRNAQQLLDGWTHKNGDPCGVREDK